MAEARIGAYSSLTALISMGVAMAHGTSQDEWVARYERSHQHPVNRACHVVGIPMIALSLLVAIAAALGLSALWVPAIAMFLLGWVLQFVGHAFERKVPEFFHDWRFLLVGLRWWFMKLKGRG